MSGFQKKPGVSIKKPVYSMAAQDGTNAEITLYGDIYEQQPTNWYGEPVEGQFITLDEFLEDLKQIEGCKALTIRMNSYGGDAGVSNVIHNRLRDMARGGAALTCIVDGVAMSGGSLIICACDTIKVNPSSIIMIHKCWTFLWGGYNADELRGQANQQDAWDKMQMEIYKRKTGLKDEEILGMMAETTYMTGREAVEKGFADELIEDAEPLGIAASADGRTLFVRGRAMHITAGMFLPDSIPTVTPGASAAVLTNKKPEEVAGQKGGNSMTKEELRAQYPDQVAEVEAEARAAVDTSAATNAAVQAERDRLAAIDEVAGLFDPQLVHEAKYGDTPCTAAELALKAAQKAAKQGSKFLADAADDAAASGTGAVGAVPPADGDGGENPIEQARADAKAFNARKKEVR
jgi:ATP-dependent protease ClpP protease subunit